MLGGGVHAHASNSDRRGCSVGWELHCAAAKALHGHVTLTSLQEVDERK